MFSRLKAVSIFKISLGPVHYILIIIITMTLITWILLALALYIIHTRFIKPFLAYLHYKDQKPIAFIPGWYPIVHHIPKII